jgi:ribonuclease P protein component
VLARKHRITESWLIRRIHFHGKSLHSSSYILNFFPNRNKENHFAFIASKKLGGAVRRNRSRRILQAAVQTLLDKFPVGYDYVLVAKIGVLAKKSNQIIPELEANIMQLKAFLRQR